MKFASTRILVKYTIGRSKQILYETPFIAVTSQNEQFTTTSCASLNCTTRPWYYGVHTQFAGGNVMLNKENIDTNGSTDCLHRNSSYQHHKFDNDSIHSNTSYFYYSGLSRSLMFTIRFSRKTMMPFSTNSNFMYTFKQQQYYRYRLCRFVLHACIGLMYNFIVLDSVMKVWAYMYIIVMKN